MNLCKNLSGVISTSTVKKLLEVKHINRFVTFSSLSKQVNSEKKEMSKFKVLIGNETVPKEALEILKPHCDIVVCKENRDDILKNIVGVDALFWASYTLNIDKNFLDEAGPSLKVVGTMSAGYNKIDVQELRTRGIKFGNTPGVVGSAAAEQAILLALSACRRLNEAKMAIERSECPSRFDATWMMGMEISGSTVGIVGFGCIGQSIAKKLQGFDVEKFLYTGHNPKPEGDRLRAEFVSLERLVKESDIIFSCVPLNDETKNLFHYELFSKMKKTAIFVNIGRGGSVNQPDLVRALRENLIFAAGLDVTAPEPPTKDDDISNLPNCIVMPHLGTNTLKTTRAMAELAAHNILRALQGKPMLTPVV